MSETELRYAIACEAVADARIQGVKGENLEALKVRRDHLWSAADREWFASLGPVSLRRNNDGSISAKRLDGRGGCQIANYAVGHPDHDRLSRAIEANQSEDARVAGAFFRHYECQPRMVRINYYGSGHNAIAVVTDGRRKLTVRMADV